MNGPTYRQVEGELARLRRYNESIVNVEEKYRKAANGYDRTDAAGVVTHVPPCAVAQAGAEQDLKRLQLERDRIISDLNMAQSLIVSMNL
jgi:hypothetical protein